MKEGMEKLLAWLDKEHKHSLSMMYGSSVYMTKLKYSYRRQLLGEIMDYIKKECLG